MDDIRITFFASALIVISACGPQPDSPYLVDPLKGTFTMEAGNQQAGPYWVEVNGSKVLAGAHLFPGSDSLVAISSSAGLDIITVFKGVGKQAKMQVSVSNPTDSAREISSLKVLFHRENDTLAGQPSAFTPGKGENSLWLWLNEDEQELCATALVLSGSSIVLLPEERIVLPPLYFFSHLCSE